MARRSTPKPRPAKKAKPVAKRSIPNPHGNHHFPIVAIGASAGGLEAIVQLLEHVPADTGAAFVVVQHLSHSHDSALPELLERKTHMKVIQVSDGMKLEADKVYVIPPATNLGLLDGQFSVSPRVRPDEALRTIDYFLSTLAQTYQTMAIAVILSGTATDGTAGVKSIKSEGGITFAQDDSARFQSMPANAIESGYIDFVMAPERIATELLPIIRGLRRIELRPETIVQKDEELRKIHLLLLKKHDVDFSLYKQTTIIRRIIRRMSLNRLSSLDAYLQLLRKDPRELDYLHRDLLINVTSFFREPALYATLTKRIFPALLKERRNGSHLRIWIPACSSGEEPYSIAICLFEYLKDKAISTPIQIFSTDLSEAAINRARAGIYSRNSLVNVSSQRLRKYFVKMDGSYQIIKPIRDICVFATHNLLKDPPFSRMDLISCQNVLIYMEQAAQKKIMQAFHYALLPAKFLILGKSETIGSSTELFDQLDKDLRIYTKKPVPANMNFDFTVRSQNYTAEDPAKEEQALIAATAKEIDVEKEAERVMLSMYMPASILVNRDLQILRFYGATFAYLQPASGKASLHLLKMIRDELIFELRSLIKQVKKDGKTARKERVQLTEGSHLRDITVEVQQVRSTGDPYLLIVFQPYVEPAPATLSKPKAGIRQDEKDRRILSLERELREAREHVKSITEDFEATREELQSANEEVLSSNEELQSINEELETSKEELQSTNEELITINDELQLRNNDLKESVDYARAIIETTREPLVILGSDLRILTMNHAFALTFRLSSDEAEGEYLFEVAGALFDLPELRTQLKKLMGRQPGATNITEVKVKHMFTALGNKTLVLRAKPIATEPGKRGRLLLAIEDVTGRRNGT